MMMDAGMLKGERSRQPNLGESVQGELTTAPGACVLKCEEALPATRHGCLRLVIKQLHARLRQGCRRRQFVIHFSPLKVDAAVEGVTHDAAW